MCNLYIKIPISGLKEGSYKFDFKIENSFFKRFEFAEIKKGKANVAVILKKSSRIIELEILISGIIEVACDLCLEMFDMPFKFKGHMYVKYGEIHNEENDEMLIINRNENEIDLSHYVYESIVLSLPYKKIHNNKPDGTSGCSKQMIEKLNIHKTKKVEMHTDPRWDKLKDIIN